MDVWEVAIGSLRTARMVLFGSIAWLACGVTLPMNQAGGLVTQIGNLVITQALADSNKNSSNNDNSSSNGNSSNSSDNGKSSSSSSGSSSSSDCLVCVDVSSISSSAFTSGSSSGNSKSESEGDSSNNANKVSMCHSAGSSGHTVTLSIDSSAVPAHLKQGDSYGACSNTIPTCAALTSSGTVIGIWVPSSAVGNDTALNTYFSDIQSGTSSGLQACSAAGATQTYQDIHGQ